MLSVIFAILTGKTKVKVSALICVLALLVLDAAEILKVPETAIGAWFTYGLFVAAISVAISLFIDVFVLCLERYRSVRETRQETLLKEERLKRAVIGNFNALSPVDRHIVLRTYFENSGREVVSLRDHMGLDSPQKSLLEQKIFERVGGTDKNPRIQLSQFVVDLIEANHEKYSSEWEQLKRY